MREWFSDDFIGNCHRLKSISAKKKKKKNAIFYYKKRFLQKLHRWISAFCSHIDLCVVHLHVYFLHGMNLQFSTIAVRMHFFMFYMRICANFGVRFLSIGVDFVLHVGTRYKTNT